MISIQTNVNSLVAQQNLSVNSAFQSKTIQQLTSGYRINQSGDDAAGLAVANKFRSTVAELTQGVANGNDATAQLQIMDGGMSNISMILDVYLGIGSGSQSLQNGVVTLGLTNSAVDSQALGMKGMEAIGGSADLGTGASSVASIVANATNLSTEATAGYATFSFSGAGYSDASKVKVQVSLSGVSDTTSLVSALNSAITAAGTGSPQALAFANAGVVASVVTDSNGQHLGFTSSTSAFQVQAGDQMANAMLGNFLSGSQGALITTTVTGGVTAAMTAPTTTTFAPQSTGVTILIQGSGLAAPVDLNIASTIGFVSNAIDNLESQVSSNSQLAAAGISLSVVGGQLQFKSATGESLSVMASGDTTNQLGLGSFVSSASAFSAVDYHTLTGLATYASTGTTTNNQATMEISINGEAATGVSVNLKSVALGATQANTTTTTALSNANIAALNTDTLIVSVDGIQATATLSGSSA